MYCTLLCQVFVHAAILHKQEVTCPTLLDLSAASDRIDHSILLQRLSLWFGLRGNVHSWFSSYLSDRTFIVSCSGCKSSPTQLATGVPQDSVLGTILFIVYTTPHSSLISQPENHNHHLQPQDLLLKHHLYADETQLHISFRPGNFSNAQSCMQRQIASISSWMTYNFLSLNPPKTEFLLIRLPQQLAKANQPVLYLPDNTTVTP